MRRRVALIGAMLLLPLAGCASFGKSNPLEYRQRLQAQREHDRALAMAEPAKESVPETVDGRVARGDRYAETGARARAYWQYLEAHKLDPDHPVPLVRLGYGALEDDAERAAALFARAIEADPERADAHAGLGGIDHLSEDLLVVALGGPAERGDCPVDLGLAAGGLVLDEGVDVSSHRLGIGPHRWR